ncbi:MAG TPA: DUF167 domain-containing protein [Candidatus Binataceae bacterium]|nr:DUF167 domain-containing protein [Candidatus Binataceae bacterium]
MSIARGHAAPPEHPAWIRILPTAVSIDILARPGAPRSEFLRQDPRGLVIALAAPADKGKANAELVALLARMAGVPRSAVSIVRGESARHKTVRIACSDPEALAARFEEIGSRK